MDSQSSVARSESDGVVVGSASESRSPNDIAEIRQMLEVLTKYVDRRNDHESPEPLQVLHTYYQSQLAIKDEAIRNLTELLSQIDVASVRRPPLNKSRLYLERAFVSLSPELHALPTLFGVNDWECELDAATQLTLTILSGSVGMRVVCLDGHPGPYENTVEYKAECMVSGDEGFPLGRISKAFKFVMVFKFMPKEGTESPHLAPFLERVVEYHPTGINDLRPAVVAGMGSFSTQGCFPISLLSSFVSCLVRTYFQASVGQSDSTRSVV
ncbi:hypothetical protein VNI00_017043 [Paramarasmius palmivorus]|uniref:Uncharacterized protein n=1 Tax=Paramarasmius palmivorus TaxID=297713 RepID=A0AAW0B7R1_9AGAR